MGVERALTSAPHYHIASALHLLTRQAHLAMPAVSTPTHESFTSGLDTPTLTYSDDAELN